jgi:hypothetical protein
MLLHAKVVRPTFKFAKYDYVLLRDGSLYPFDSEISLGIPNPGSSESFLGFITRSLSAASFNTADDADGTDQQRRCFALI